MCFLNIRCHLNLAVALSVRRGAVTGFSFLFAALCSMKDLSSLTRLGIKPASPAMEVQS